MGVGAAVTILDVNPTRLRYVHDILEGHVTTVMSNQPNIEEEVLAADLVIGAVLIPGARAPRPEGPPPVCPAARPAQNERPLTSETAIGGPRQAATPSPTPDASALPFPDPVVAVRCWPLIEHCPLTPASAAWPPKAFKLLATLPGLAAGHPDRSETD